MCVCLRMCNMIKSMNTECGRTDVTHKALNQITDSNITDMPDMYSRLTDTENVAYSGKAI